MLFNYFNRPKKSHQHYYILVSIYMSNYDSSEIPDFDDNAPIEDITEKFDKKNMNIHEEATGEYVKNVVMDKIIKYVKIDDMIMAKQKEHRAEIKEMKTHKNELEDFILAYLDKINQEYVVIGNQNKLTKQTKESKGTIKINDIADAIREDYMKQNVNIDVIEGKVKDFLQVIESKRQTKIKKMLCRTNPEKEQKKKLKSDAKTKLPNGNKR